MALKPHLGWRWKRIGIARARKGLKGLKGNWETLSYSLRIQIREELRSLMPVMVSTS